ncbi:MAG: Hsp20/alpha crystallin family protein [Candidatus Eiseniibacteriota bacterium]
MQCSAYIIPKYNIVTNKVMSHDKSEITISDKKRTIPLLYRPVDNMLESFRRDIQNAFLTLLWPWDGDFHPLEQNWIQGHHHAIWLTKVTNTKLHWKFQEVPKEKIDIKTRKKRVEVSGQQEKTEVKRKNYVYNEQSYQSFSRGIPIPEEINPSKVEGKMENGLLRIELPKKPLTTVDEEETKVNVK